MFLKTSQNSQENTHARVSFLIKLHASACNCIKNRLCRTGFSYKFCEISKNTLSYRTPPVAASRLIAIGYYDEFHMDHHEIYPTELEMKKESTGCSEQNYLPGGVLYKRCSEKFRKIPRKTPVSGSFFKKVADSDTYVFLWMLWNF